MTYGCGADGCKACYPFTYRCEVCMTDYPQPVPNGEKPPACSNCEYDGENPETADLQAKDADGYCLTCREPHEADSCPIWANQEEVPQTLTDTTS